MSATPEPLQPSAYHMPSRCPMPGRSLRVIATLPVHACVTCASASDGKISRNSFISHAAARVSAMGCNAARPPITMRVPSGEGR